jgi:deoxyribose-phosphate aldolase
MMPPEVPADEQPRPPLSTESDLARLIDYALLSPRFSDEQIVRACEVARKNSVASITTRPIDIATAVRSIGASGIRVGAVVSYPHGAATTAVKLYETRDALQRGATFIETVLNPGAMASRQFRYIETELLQMAQECHRSGAMLTVDLELPWLPPDLRVIACRIAKRAEVDVVRAASLFGPSGYTVEDLAFLIEKCGELVKVDAGHSVRKWEDAIAAYALGCAGFQSTDPTPILESWRAEIARRHAENASASESPAGSSTI